MRPPTAIQLAKHPLRYYLQRLRELTAPKKDERLLDQATFTMPGGRLLITCHDEAVHAKLTGYQTLIPTDFRESLGLKEIVVQFDVAYLILQALRRFEQEGRREFTLQDMVAEVNRVPPVRKESFIKGALQECAKDLGLMSFSSATQPPEWLLEIRGEKPLIRNLGKGNYEIMAKTGKGKRAGKK